MHSLFSSPPLSKILTNFGIGVGPIGITHDGTCYCRLIQEGKTRKHYKSMLDIFWHHQIALSMEIKILDMSDSHENHENLPSIPTSNIHMNFRESFVLSCILIFYVMRCRYTFNLDFKFILLIPNY